MFDRKKAGSKVKQIEMIVSIETCIFLILIALPCLLSVNSLC